MGLFKGLACIGNEAGLSGSRGVTGSVKILTLSSPRMVLRMEESSNAMSDSRSAWSVSMRVRVKVEVLPVRAQQPKADEM